MNMKLSRRRFVQAAAGTLALPVLPVFAEEPERKFWFLDQRMVGIREFYHIYGMVQSPIELPASPKLDMGVRVTFDPELGSAEGNWTALGWEVERVLSSGKNLYRLRTIPDILKVVNENIGSIELVPNYELANPWMSPLEAETKHGIVLRTESRGTTP